MMMTLRLLIAAACAVLWACSPQQDLSQAHIATKELLAGYRQAIAGHSVPGVYHLVFRTISSTGDVAVTNLYEAGTRGSSRDYRAITTEHGVRVERGRIAGRSWRQDANGLVLPDSEPPTIFERLLLAAVHKADTRVRLLGITKAPLREYVLDIAPNAQLLQRRYFDVGTFLPRKTITRDYDRRIQVDRYADYVEVGGRPVASRELRSDSLSTQTFRTTLMRHERLPFDAALLAVPRLKSPFVAQYPLPATINSIFGTSGILIRVDIKGAPYWLRLDSGAAAIALDRDLVQRLGLHEFGKYTTTKGGRLDTSFAVLPRVDIGPVYAQRLTIGVIPWDHMEQGVEVVGLLGCDFIASGPLAIDFRKQTVTAIRELPAASDHHWTGVPTPLHECTPSIAARLERQPATLVLDLGSPSTVVNEDVLGAMGGTVRALDTTRVRYVGGEPLTGTQYAVSQASAGRLNFGPFVATVIGGGRGQDLDNDGLLGTNVLDNYRLVLDYAHQRTYFSR